MREPVPLRCDSCGEIIYQDQAWDEYGGDYDCSDLPWHTVCWERREAEREADRKRSREHIEELKARPWESLSFEEATILTLDHTSKSLIDAICAPDLFPGGAAAYFGPGKREGGSE